MAVGYVEATCTEDGNIAYWYCADCDKYFSDAEATEEISLADTVIPATGHNSLTYFDATAATCTTDGNIEYWYCEDCGKYYSDAEVATEISQSDTVIATGHSYDENDVCTVCGAHKPTEGLSYIYYSSYKGYSVSIGTATDTVIYIADTYDDGTHGTYSVTTIGYSAFWGCSSLTGITIPDSVTSIGDYVFDGCTSLTSVTIPDSVTSMGDYVFAGCSSLESVTIGNSVTSIGDDAFFNCTSLESVTIGNSVTSIGSEAFFRCSSLESINIPDGVTSIGGIAFYNCTSLTSINIPDSVTSIGNQAFSGCTALSKVYITDLEAWCNITFPNSLANPMDYANNLYLNDVIITGDIVLSNNVTTIPDYTFKNSTITSITIPDSVTSIGSYAFWGCDLLENVYITDLEAWCNISFSNSLANPMDYANNLYLNGVVITGDIVLSNNVITIPLDTFKNSAITSITIPDSVTSIGSGAFYNCTSLKSITIPGNVTSIENRTFYNCTSLESAIIGNGVESIDGWAFENCTSLTNITIPDSVTSIGDGTFYRCISLESVTIPDKVTSISYSTFYYCTSLESVTLPGSVTSIGNEAFYNCSALKSITIPGSITSIGSITFYNCTSLTSVTIEDGATSIGTNTFYNCISLTSITIPGSVTSIGSNTFYHCTSLESVIISNGVTSIYSGAFEGCTLLTSVTIPSSMTSIGSDAFRWCFKLIEVYNLSSLTITAGSTDNGYIGCYAKNIYTSESGSSYLIPQDDYIFYNDNGTYYLIGYTGSGIALTLPSLTVNGTAVNYSVYQYAFYNNTKIISITIPDSVTSIGDSAFGECYKLIEVHNLSSLTITAESTDNGYVGYYAKNVYGTSGSSYIIPQDDYIFYNDNGTYYLISYTGSGTSLTLPTLIVSGVAVNYSIYQYAFYNNTKIKSVTIGDNITSIGDSAFYGCTSFTSLTIGNSVTSIGGDAFRDCILIESVTIPNSVTSIGNYAFYGCSSLTSVYYSGTASQWANISFSSSSSNPLYYAVNLYLNGTLATDISVDTTTINAYAFYNYTSLTSVTIGSNVTSIDSCAFYGCTSLESIIIPDRVTSINSSAFNNCTSLTSVTIGSAVTSINIWAFYGCSSLENVYYKGTVDEWSAITIGSYNTYLTSATIYYYSESEPDYTDGYNYWHYVDGEIVVWIQSTEE